MEYRYEDAEIDHCCINDTSDDYDVMDWYVYVFCNSFYKTVEQNLDDAGSSRICCDQLFARVISPDINHRFVCLIYTHVDQLFKNIDDNIDMAFIIHIVDRNSNDWIEIELPAIPMGKMIIIYHEPDKHIVDAIREVLVSTGECVIKLINAA